MPADFDAADGLCRGGARGAHQGHGADPGRANQPAGRLRTGGGPRRHRRSNQPGAFHNPVAHQYARAVGRGRARERDPAAQERGRGRSACGAAGVRQAGADHRHHGEFARERQEPARRVAPGHAAARPRRPDLRHRAGKSDRLGLRRAGQRRLEAHRQRAEFRPHPQRGDGREGGAHGARAGRCHSTESQRSGFHHRNPAGRERQQGGGGRAWRASSTGDPCGCAPQST